MYNPGEWITLNSSFEDMSFDSLIKEIKDKLRDYDNQDINFIDYVAQFRSEIDDESAVINLITNSDKIISKIELYLIPDENESGEEIETVDVYLDDNSTESLSVYESSNIFDDWFSDILKEAGLNSEEKVRTWWENGYNHPIDLELVYEQIVSCMSKSAKKVSEVAMKKFIERYPKSYLYLRTKVIEPAVQKAFSYFENKGLTVTVRKNEDENCVLMNGVVCFSYYMDECLIIALRELFRKQGKDQESVEKRVTANIKSFEGRCVLNILKAELDHKPMYGGKYSEKKGTYSIEWTPNNYREFDYPIEDLIKELESKGHEVLDIELDISSCYKLLIKPSFLA